MTTENTPKIERVWPFLVSVLTQQLVFAACLFCYPLLMYVSIWVVRVPVAIIWSMALVLPIAYIRPLSARRYLRSYATVGWIYVLASTMWIIAYWYFSDRDGAPVSWDAVAPHFKP